jgi:beta-phosphoglucomutase-like phosphatase (HAD superfamily)
MRRFELVSRLEFMFENFVGRSMQQCWEQVAGMLGKEVPAHWRREFELRTTAALEAEVQAVCGIEAVLDSLEVPYCVASSGSHATVSRGWGALHVQQYGQASRTAPGPVY